MNRMKPLQPMKLIRQAEESGLLNSNMTVHCVNCNAVFPKEYDNCPQCSN